MSLRVDGNAVVDMVACPGSIGEGKGRSSLVAQTPSFQPHPLFFSLLPLTLQVPSSFPTDFVSYVSLGDGSVNNAHFLAGANLAAYAKFRSFKCPLVLAISDNDLCISLRGYGWLRDGFSQKLGLPVHVADGSNLFDVFAKSRHAIEEARITAQPHVLIFTNLPRRFGHAATDRQDAYMTAAEVEKQAMTSPISGTGGRGEGGKGLRRRMGHHAGTPAERERPQSRASTLH